MTAEFSNTEQFHKIRDSSVEKPWALIFSNSNLCINWIFVLLFFGLLGDFILDVLKNGFGDGLPPLYTIPSYLNPSPILLFYWTLPSLICFVIETIMSMVRSCTVFIDSCFFLGRSRGRIESIRLKLSTSILIKNIMPQKPLIFLHSLNLFGIVGIPILVTQHSETPIISSFVTFILYMSLLLKLWSYIHVNLWCRTSIIEDSSGGNHYANNDWIQYPNNLTLANLLYFLAAPTLCYELNFPKTKKIRIKFILMRLFEIISNYLYFIHVCKRFIAPQLLRLNDETGLLVFLEVVLKISIPNHLAWICLIYISIQASLELMGEILYFGDRDFYRDWWNSTTIDEFWKTWNLPVHRWAIRHLYGPLITMGYGKEISKNTVFYISAFFHELMICVPLRTNGMVWAFIAMIGQIPLNDMSIWIKTTCGPKLGNLTLWLSLLFGHSVCVALYYQQYIQTHGINK